MSHGIRVIPESLRVLAFGAIGPVFTNFNVFEHAIRILSIKNLTDQILVFSLDGGANINEILPSQSGLVLDFTANSNSTAFPFIAAGTVISVASLLVPPTSGLAAVSAYYCVGD